MTDYDTSRLAELGERRRQVRAELKEIGEQIEREIASAHAAGVIQADLSRLSGMTRESVAQLCLPPEQRWKRGAPKTPAKPKRTR